MTTTHTTPPRALLDRAINSSSSADSPAAILKRETAKAKREHWENALWLQLVACHLPLPARNVYWHPTRRYHSEFVYTDARDMLIIEVDGGIWLTKSGHTTGRGYERDRIRDAEALAMGYTVLRLTPGMISNGQAVQYIEKVLRTLWRRNLKVS